jgi:hypothetical protein
VAERAGLLNRCTSLNLYRGFESLPLRWVGLQATADYRINAEKKLLIFSIIQMDAGFRTLLVFFSEKFKESLEPLGLEPNATCDLHSFALLCTLNYTQASSIYMYRKTFFAYGITQHPI